MQSSDIIESTIEEVLKVWNKAVKESGIEADYKLDIHARVKQFYTTKTKYYEQRIGELNFFYVEKDKTYLLWRKEINVADKVKHTPDHEILNEARKDLFKYFLYEAIGVFGLQCKQLIDGLQYSEYDIKKDRIKGDNEYEACVIEVIEDGAFYEKGDTFDVFTKQNDVWGVYTSHDLWKGNNGIGKIANKDVKVIVNPKPVIEVAKSKILGLDGKPLFSGN